jgi:hypothetical protein
MEHLQHFHGFAEGDQIDGIIDLIAGERETSYRRRKAHIERYGISIGNHG